MSGKLARGRKRLNILSDLPEKNEIIWNLEEVLKTGKGGRN